MIDLDNTYIINVVPKYLADTDIRKSLLPYIRQNYISKDTDIIVSEMGIFNGKSVVDLAVLNGCMHAFEIKSDKDTLERLETQLSYYSKMFSYISVVTTEKHLNKLNEFYPKYIGITLVANLARDKIHFYEIRKPELNPEVSKEALIKLLWKDELLSLYKARNVEIKKNQRKSILQEVIIEDLDYVEILKYVKQFFSTRTNWQVV